MGRFRIKIGVLTSSRADYGIYLPLLKRLYHDTEFELSVIVFGTHLKTKYGKTISQIEEDGFNIAVRIDNLRFGDTPREIALNYAHTGCLFAEYWRYSSYDYVLCLGDRFEMAAAVNAGIPFGITFVHIHAGETSLGSIDNIYRDQISLASKLHFVAIESFMERIECLIQTTGTAFYSGAIGLENLKNIQLLSEKEFENKWGIDLSMDTVLVTVHPETVDLIKNRTHISELQKALEHLSDEIQILITMPNADTSGSLYRSMFLELKKKYGNQLHVVENLGTQSYFSAMHLSSLLLGNTSSGIIEAASFGKYVINLGNRQKGRAHSKNVIHSPFNSKMILDKTREYINKNYSGSNIYYREEGSKYIVSILKEKRNVLSKPYNS